MERKKVYLGFDSYRLKETFSYVSLENLVHHLEEDRIPYTLNPEEDFDIAIYPSSEDMISQRPKVGKKKVENYLLAIFDVDDFNDDPNASKFLSDASINCANGADKILTFFESQMKALLRMGIRKEIGLLPLKPTFDNDDLLQSERDAFRSFYRIPADKTTILTFGFKRDPGSIAILEDVARIFPDYEFLCFSEMEQDFFRRKMQERLYQHANIRYLSHLPQELYHSALLSTDCLFFPQIVLTYPMVIGDFIDHLVPIVSYRAIDLPELVNEETAFLPKDFPSLYRALKDIRIVNKAKAAKDNLLRFRR